MYDATLGNALNIPIRLEDSAGDPVTGKESADLTVKKCDYSDADWVTVAGGNRSLNELSEGDYTLTLVASQITKIGFMRIKVSCSGCQTKQYVVNIIPTPLDIYFKSTGSDTTGDGTYSNPYQSLNKCLTVINNRPGFTIHVLDDPANVAGNKDQNITEQVTIKGNGYDWQSVVPTSWNIGVSTNAKGVVLENLSIIKIHLDSSSFDTIMKGCRDVSAISRFSENGHFEDCIFSAAITGGGTDFGKRAKWIRCVFKENVDVNITQDGGIFKDCVFEKNLDTGVAQYTVYDNCTIHGVLTGENNTAFNGQVVFKNPYINNNTVLNGKKYIIIGGVIRGALTFEVNSVDCVVWGTRVKGGITDSGTGNEINNYSAWSILVSQDIRDSMKLAPSGGAPAAGSVDQHLDDILAGQVLILSDTGAILIDTNEIQGKLPTGTIAGAGDKMDLIDLLVHKVGSSGYDRTTDSLEAIGERTQAIPDKAKIKDIVHNRNVLTRHPAGPGEDKPKTIAIGAGGAEGTVTTTIDGNGNLQQESIS